MSTTVDTLRSATCDCGKTGMTKLGDAEQKDLLASVPSWDSDGKSLERTIKLKDFKANLALVNRIGDLAEVQGHHPDLSIFSWNNLRISLSTHDAGGLTRNDFIMAAKIDEIIESSANGA